MKAKIRSKHILLLFVGIIILLLGGIFLAAQQEKEGSITAEAASVYWEIPDFCPECGAENSDINMTRTDFTRVGDGCTFTYEHKIRSGIYCTGTVTIHTGVSVAAKNPTCTSSGNTAGAKCGICGIPDPKNPVRTIAALGHNYVAEWSGSDYQSATVRFKCSRCSSKLPDEATITERTVKEATCTEQGQRIYTATLEYRGETYIDVKNESLPALGHDIENHAGKEPTCTAVGWNAYETCSRCDYTTYQEIAATGHTPGAAATCTTPQTCTECGTTLAEATGHTWDSGTISKNPTCYSTGIKRYECTTCGEIKTETLSKVSHDYTLYRSRIEPTCTTSGRTAGYECRWCTATTCSTIPALGHSYGSYTQTKAPTCTEKGTETAKCIRCTSQKTRNIDALGHDLEYHAGKEPTCTSVGWNAYETCNRAGCAYTTYREIAATGHTPGAAATCTTSQTCTVCGATLVEALGHKTVSHLGQDPTCTAEGWKPYETCENCDYTTYEEIEALGHSFTSYVSDNNATCLEDGTETAKCDRCEVTDTRTDEGSALGHDWAEKWTTDGTAHWHECSRCDEINDKATHSGGAATCIALAKCEICGVEYGELAEHVYVENAEEQYLASAATCTAKATYYKSCSVCREAGEEVFEYGEPLGHEYGEPEWTWEGYTSATATFTCTRGCGDKQTATAAGSSITNVVTTPAECETEGLRTYTAKVMFGGEEYVTTTTETIEALGHDWAEKWTTDGASHWHKCSRCDEINDKAKHSGGTATCIDLAKCEICGVEYGDFAEHVYVENADEQYLVSAATCTVKATYYKSCSVCGEAGEEVFEYGEPLGHEYGGPEWTWEGYTSATATFTCTREDCGDKQTATASGSSITSIVTTPAECEAEGLRTYTAKVMFGGEEYVTTTTETLEALGHDLEHHEAKPATCTEIGWNAYDTCTRCDYTTYVEIEALGHDWAEEWTTDGTAHWHECSRCDEINGKANHNGGTATCTEPAECEVCGVAYGEALGHSFTSYVSNNDATCTEDGTETAKCDRCDATDTRTDEGSVLGHDWAVEWTTDGTSHWHKCTRCDEINDKTNHSGGTATCIELAECEVCGVEYGEFAEHAYVENAEEQYLVSAATCTASATYFKSCSVCGEAGEEVFEYGEPLGHEYGEPEWTWEGYTSTTATFTCTRGCGDKQTATAAGSSITSVVTTPAECETEGLRTYTAKVMFGGEEYVTTTTETLEALGHDLEHHEAKPATCTEIGWNAYDTCTRCDYTTYEEIEALRHDWAEEWTTDGTAHWHECSRCDEINDKANHSGGTATCTEPAECEVCGVAYGGALGHDLQHHDAQAATCTEIGWNAYDTCSRCDYTTYEEISALGHTEGEAVRENEVDATCTVAGSYDEVVYCSVCDEELSREEKTIEALGHDLEHHEAQAATCTEIGWNAYDTCSRCDYTTYEEIPALGHTEGEAVRENEVDATCTVAGSYDEVVYCSVCGEELSREEKTIEALGHSFTSYVSNNDATCTVDGTETAKCDRCEVTDTRTDEGSALGHDWAEEWTTDGTSHWHECSRCDEINDKAPHSGGTSTCVTPAECEVCGVEYGEALGHTEGEPVRENEVSASCTEAGSYDEVVYCSVCGEELSREEKVIDALGHDIIEHEGQAATCTQNGWNAYETCNRTGCGYTTYREIAATGHTPGAAATCTTPQTCTVCGATLVEALGHSFVDGYCTTCGVSDEEALENDREDAKTDLDDVAQDVKDEIDASDLPDDVKEDLKDKVDEIVNGAKDEVDGSTDFDDVNQAVEDAKEEIEDTILNAEKDDAKSDLDEIVQNAKDEIGASDLPDDVKEDLKDKVDEIVNGAKDEVDGSTDFDDVNQAVEDAKEEIEDTILNAEKDDAKSDLDEIVQNAKDEIDASELPDDVKEDLKDKLDEIINDTKAEIDSETTKEEVEAAVEDARQEIEDALLNAEKDDAKSDLDEIVQNAKDEIDASELSDEEKNELKGKLDEVLSSAKEEIGNATSKEEVDAIVNDVRKDIEDLLNGSSSDEISEEKEVAVSDLENTVQNAKDEIDASDLSDEEKNELKGKLDEVLSSAKEEIGNATSKEEVDAIVNDVRKDIEDLLNGSSSDEISEEKDVAVSDLENTVQNAKDEIDASDLSDEEKDELKGKLDEVLSSAKEEIGIAATTEEIEEVLTSAKEEIAALTEKLTEGQPDASPLWPWLIAAVVISAALAAIFAWRHVRSVRGKGETIGVRSVVTIAVATILIFVLVIGIALLIFAMI